MSALDKKFNDEIQEMLIHVGGKPEPTEAPAPIAPPPPLDPFNQGIQDFMQTVGTPEVATMTFDNTPDIPAPLCGTEDDGRCDMDDGGDGVCGGNFETGGDNVAVSIGDDGSVAIDVGGIKLEISPETAKNLADQLKSLSETDEEDDDSEYDESDDEEEDGGDGWETEEDESDESSDDEYEDSDDEDDDEESEDDDDDSDDEDDGDSGWGFN